LLIFSLAWVKAYGENNFPLIGYKKDSYGLRLKALKESSRYKGLNLAL
jgi:hypothetical protein